MRASLIWLLVLWCSGCTSEDTKGPAPGTPPTTDSGTGSTTGSTPTTHTGTTDSSVPLPEFDCTTIPETALGIRLLPGARGYHDVAFDDSGHILGANGTFGASLLAADYDGNTAILVPGIGTVQQFVWLPDGDLAVASDSSGLIRISPGGGITLINGNIYAYGLILGPDEMLYAADQNVVQRVDPSTGQAETLVASVPRGTPRVLNFSLNYDRLFIGTLGGNGDIYSVDLDANLDPISTPSVFATGVGTGSFHDTLGVDICGYLYVADYSTSALYRVNPSTGNTRVLLDAGGFLAPEYGHGMEWGTGEDGWLHDAIYMPQPYNGNTVTEAVIGVPSRHWEGVGINLP